LVNGRLKNWGEVVLTPLRVAHRTNAVESTCGGIKFAFALSGRTYLVSYAESCESDSFSAALIHDLSEKQPKLVKF
jgi:hypothetical protein